MRDKRTNEQQQLKIELLSQWKLEAESRNTRLGERPTQEGTKRVYFEYH